MKGKGHLEQGCAHLDQGCNLAMEQITSFSKDTHLEVKTELKRFGIYIKHLCSDSASGMTIISC